MVNTILADGLSGSIALTLHGGNLIPGQPGYADPKLGPLQDNGGPTPTMLLLPGSPAIDAGDSTLAVDAHGNPLTTDQRGFPRSSGPKVDIGAYEVQQASLSPTPANGQADTPYSQSITATQAGYQASWGTFTFAVTAGTMPTGLSLSGSGVLSGTPTAVGTFHFTVAASNLAGFGSQQCTITVSPPPAPVVDTLADNFDYDYSAGHLSLREALNLAQLPGVNAPVTLAPGLHGTIALTGGPLTITSGVTIQGPGANLLAIAGGSSDVFDVTGPNASHLITTNISGLTITNANNGISNTNATLSLSGVVVTGNSADGIYNDQAVLHVVNSTIRSNQGSGIVDVDGVATLAGSTVADNTGGDSNGNGGGISVVGTLGGYFEATLTAVNTTIAGNTAYFLGGGIYASGATSLAAGGYVPVQVTLTNVTVAGNSATDGAGVYNSTGSMLTIQNTILGANKGAPDLTNDETIGASTVAQDANLVESAETVIDGVPQTVDSGFASNSSVISADPKLGPLQNNGGPTPTMALLPGSPAIDAGANSFALDLSGNPLQTDQNGFPRSSGAKVDLGAYEMQPVSVGPAALLSGALGGSYLQNLTATQAGSQPSWGQYTFAVTAGALPTGLSLTPWGLLSGSPSAVGTFTFTVTASNLAGFGSQQYTMTIQYPTAISVSASSVALVPGQSVKFTATVTTPNGGTAPSDGTVTFYVDGKVFGTPQPLSGSPATATLTTATLALGQHSISVSYSGDSTFAPSSGGVQAVVPASGLKDPWAVAVDGPGDVLIADPANNRVVKVQPDGTQSTVGSGLDYPWGVAVDGHCDVFIADGDQSQSVNQVVEVKPDGTQTTVGSGFSLPWGLAVDNAGDVFIADALSAQVVKVKPDGTQTTVASGFTPGGLALDSAGDLFIADFDNNRVVEVKPDGTQTTVVSGLNQPLGLALDSAGDLFVAENANNQVVEVMADGATTPVVGGLNAPAGLAVDGQGDVFIADQNNDRVVELRPGLPVKVSPATPSFSGLSAAPSISYGTASVHLSGTLAAGQNPVPEGETVTVTAGSASTTATIGNNGSFSAYLPTNSLEASSTAYAIVYSYAGDSNFASASNQQTALTVNPLVVTLGGSPTYDGTMTAAASALSITNAVSGDNVTLSGSATLAGANAGTKGISSVAGLTLGGSADGNYTLSGASGSVNIIQAPLTVTADAKIETVGSTTDPALTYRITAGTLFNGDSLGGKLIRDPGTAVGSYVIRRGTLTAGPNYALSFVNNVLFITSATTSLTSAQSVAVSSTGATATAATSAQGTAPQLTATASGFDGTLTVAQYASSPSADFSASGAFFDANVASNDLGSNSSVVLTFNNLTAQAPLFWSNGHVGAGPGRLGQ
jgi:hypothetical protein